METITSHPQDGHSEWGIHIEYINNIQAIWNNIINWEGYSNGWTYADMLNARYYDKLYSNNTNPIANLTSWVADEIFRTMKSTQGIVETVWRGNGENGNITWVKELDSAQWTTDYVRYNSEEMLEWNEEWEPNLAVHNHLKSDNSIQRFSLKDIETNRETHQDLTKKYSKEIADNFCHALFKTYLIGGKEYDTFIVSDLHNDKNDEWRPMKIADKVYFQPVKVDWKIFDLKELSPEIQFHILSRRYSV